MDTSISGASKEASLESRQVLGDREQVAQSNDAATVILSPIQAIGHVAQPAGDEQATSNASHSEPPPRTIVNTTENASTEVINSPGFHAANESTPSLQATESEVGSDVIDLNLNLSDTDSILGASIASSTVSLRESIYEYIKENGRTYHAYKAGAYHVPNDEAEQERLDLQHHLFRMTMNGFLHAAPVSHPHNVLDIATGTGIWAIEFAQEFPGANVIGTDLSPIQPSYVPSNCKFLIEDCEDDWDFSQKFDLIHGRALLSCFSRPRKVMASIFDALAPSGYFELQDICFPCQSPDGTLEGTSLQKWQRLMIEGLRNLGKDFEKVKEYGGYMREAGFGDVVERKYTWAIGPWIRGAKQKLQATWWMQNFLDGIHGWSMAIITKGMGWTPPEVEVLLVGVRDDVSNWRNVHAYVHMYVVYGRKP